MEDPKGSVKVKVSPKTMNGINGHARLVNGHATTSRRKATPKQRQGLLSWTFGLVAR
jgi:hypothetical protein